MANTGREEQEGQLTVGERLDTKGPEQVEPDGPEPAALTQPERAENLFRLALAPSLWFAHFLACYLTVALYCAKLAPPLGSLGFSRPLCLGYTVLALVAIALCARSGHRRHRFGDAPIPHDFDTSADRHRFLGFAELLLSVMSFVAVIYVALPFLFLETCR